MDRKEQRNEKMKGRESSSSGLFPDNFFDEEKERLAKPMADKNAAGSSSNRLFTDNFFDDEKQRLAKQMADKNGTGSSSNRLLPDNFNGKEKERLAKYMADRNPAGSSSNRLFSENFFDEEKERRGKRNADRNATDSSSSRLIPENRHLVHSNSEPPKNPGSRSSGSWISNWTYEEHESPDLIPLKVASVKESVEDVPDKIYSEYLEVNLEEPEEIEEVKDAKKRRYWCPDITSPDVRNELNRFVSLERIKNTLERVPSSEYVDRDQSASENSLQEEAVKPYERVPHSERQGWPVFTYQKQTPGAAELRVDLKQETSSDSEQKYYKTFEESEVFDETATEMTKSSLPKQRQEEEETKKDSETEKK